MSPYLITAKPNRWHLLVRAARHLASRIVVALGLAFLACVVLVLRTVRVWANLAAEAAARAEFAACKAARVPPIGATIGATVTAAFVDEFHVRYAEQPDDEDLTAQPA